MTRLQQDLVPGLDKDKAGQGLITPLLEPEVTLKVGRKPIDFLIDRRAHYSVVKEP